MPKEPALATPWTGTEGPTTLNSIPRPAPAHNTPTNGKEPHQPFSPSDTRRQPCPLCGFSLSLSDLATHCELELRRVADGQTVQQAVEDATGPSRVRRGAALAAAQQIASVTKGKAAALASNALNQLDEDEMLLYTLRANNLKRKAELGVGAKPTSHKRRGTNNNNNSGVGDGGDGDSGRCFMCDQPLPLEAEALNRHIDECLEAQKNAAAGASSSSGLNVPAIDQGGSGEQWEEYTWAGQTRVRASAMLEGGFAASGFTVRKPAEQDTDEEIDIDDDGTDEFGQTQFGEQHLDPFRSTDDIDPGANADAQPGTVGDSRDTYPSTDHPPSSSSDTKLVIDALKSRIRDLERLSSTSPKCLICLDPYTDPLVSIVCWHVHCEQCWFRTLGTKRLCPQCQKITAPADLRRVYL